MSETVTRENRARRRAQEHNITRTAILDAARRVGVREGARHLSLRSVATEAGFAPAALYGYFSSKDDLLLALAAEDLSRLVRTMRDSAASGAGRGHLRAAVAAALQMLQQSETFANAPAALTAGVSPDSERLFNGRMIAALRALSDLADWRVESREAQADIVLIGASVAGLAMMARSGRLAALGFSDEEILDQLERRFAPR